MGQLILNIQMAFGRMGLFLKLLTVLVAFAAAIMLIRLVWSNILWIIGIAFVLLIIAVIVQAVRNGMNR